MKTNTYYIKTLVVSVLFLIIAVTQLAALGTYSSDDNSQGYFNNESNLYSEDPTREIRTATVKILTTSLSPSYYIPWKMKSHNQSTGSGVIIADNLILTNAHVVSDATYLLVQKESDPEKYEAEVLYIGHECDLALLKVKNENFFNDTVALEISDSLPQLKSTVTTYGYPMGGTRISITQGVVSRIQIGTYSHSMESSFLEIQTDVAINPGNSGGPVIQNNKVVGIAFQIASDAENIGYLIPPPIIQHFLDDVKDDIFDGFPKLGIYWQPLENPSHREYLGMSLNMSGILISKVISNSNAEGYLQDGDVILAIENNQIGNDGSISFENGRILYSHLISAKYIGESVTIDIIRNNELITTSFPLNKVESRIVSYNEYELLPRYFIFAGIIFQPLNRDFLKTWKDWWYNADRDLMYMYMYNDIDDLYPDKKEFIIINKIIPDYVNTYFSNISNIGVSTINNIKITCLEDVIEAFKHPLDGYHVIITNGGSKPLILKAEGLEERNMNILNKYGITSDRRLDSSEG